MFELQQTKGGGGGDGLLTDIQKVFIKYFKQDWSPRVCRVSPISTQLFLLYNIHIPLNARVSGYLDLTFHNLSPFGLKIRIIYRKHAKRGHIGKF